jgi:flagellin-specific chaperone FliS
VTNNALDSKAKAVSQLFEDADVALTEYKKSKSHTSSEHFSESLKKIPHALNELKLEVGDDPSKQKILHNLDLIVEVGVKLLTELRTEADNKNPAEFRARHMYKDSHSVAETVNEELTGFGLMQEKPKDGHEKGWSK